MEPKLRMYQEVPYEAYRRKCKTECPYGMKSIDDDCVDVSKVGSVGCYVCKYHVGKEERIVNGKVENIVKCSHPLEEE